MPSLDWHYKIIIKHLTAGTLVPFLGAGANLCGRPRDKTWQQGQYLPSGRELAALLAKNYAYPSTQLRLHCPACQAEIPGPEEAQDLLRVSQYVASVAGGLADLYVELHKIFDADYPATTLHHFLAALPGALAKKGYPQRELLVVTTNYDDLMERAFREVGQPFDTLTYVAEGDYRGRFLHSPPQGDPIPIGDPNTYAGLSFGDRPVVLKIHGAVSRGANWKRDSYVIREDDYIEYLAHTTDITNVLPSILVAKLKESHLLFLGYSLSDWNLRVILYRIWSQQAFDYKSWAIQMNTQAIDQQFWAKRNVEILDANLEDYVTALQVGVENLEQGTGEPPLTARVA